MAIANRRMFSQRIISSARFLMMPISCQALYFHLGMNADDDGVVEAYPVMKMVGCKEDDLRVLVSKNYVQLLNDELVTYILDWNENNKIRADRKIDSIYKDLLLKINPDADLIEKKDRADVKKRSVDGQWTDNGRTMDGIGKDRLGKDSIGKNKERKPQKRFAPPSVEEVRAYIAEKGYTHVNADSFVAFYESKNWMVGKNKMVSWHSCVAGWEAREKDKKPTPQNRFAVQDNANAYDFDELERKARERRR